MQKSILITGCSSGIGLCVADTLKKRGYRVFATARKAADVAKLNAQGFESYALDVNDSDSIRTVLDDILSKTQGTLYGLFNNAGFGQTGAVEDLNRDLIRKQFETNVFGPMELTTQVLPVMRKQGYGRIIQNTSMLGIVALPYYGAYNASKFALEAFSNTLRLELRHSPIFVSTILCGPIRSEFRHNAYDSFKTTINKKESVHQSLYSAFEKEFAKEKESYPPFTLGPEAVAKKIVHALESQKPRAHYYVTVPAHLVAIFRRFLPDGALDWVLANMIRPAKEPVA